METTFPTNPALSRRQCLLGTAGAAVLASAAPAAQAAKTKTQAHIVILGGGLGGIAVANRLHALLDGAKITLIDRKEEHNYQPGYTLVATGVWPVSKVRDRNADFHPPQLNWIKDMVSELDPARTRWSRLLASASSTTTWWWPWARTKTGR